MIAGERTFLSVERDRMTIEQTAADDAEQDDGGRLPMAPVRNRPRRALICGGLCVFALVGSASLVPKLAFCLSMGLLLGSFPQACLEGGVFHRELYVLFLMVRRQKWKLERFHEIETELEDKPFESVANVFQSGEWMNRIWGVFDACVPWLGGDYKIWLRSTSGKRVLAWQGSNEQQYKSNLELLRRQTGLPVEWR